MATVEIYREQIPSSDPRLKRHVLHDSRAWNFRFDTTGLSIASVEHQRTLPILDQGQVGSCTADCGIGILGTAPYSGDQATGAAVTKAFGGWTQDACYRLYSAEETLDGDGPYPPNDQGSTGLTLAKVLRNAGAISGWQQTFTLDDALKALSQYPLALGTVWLNSMFTPAPDGLLTVDPSSGIAGGHEYEAVGYDATTDRVKIANSWSPSWGVDGYAHIRRTDLGWLLSQRGDVTVFVPLTQPAPTPVPAPPNADPADVTFAAAFRQWAQHPRLFGSARLKAAGNTWLAEKPWL